MFRKLMILLLVVSLMLGLTWGVAAAPGVTENKIKIGTFQALSGPVAPIGTAMTHGMQAYFKQLNNQGGVSGRKIKLLVEDDQFRPSQTIAAVRRLVQRNRVFSIVGGLGTPTCLAVFPYLSRHNVPFVYPAGGASKFVDPRKENVFVVQPNYKLEGNIMAQFIVEELGKKKIGFIHNNTSQGIEGSQSAIKKLKDYNIKPVANITFSSGTVDYTSRILELKEAGAEVVVIHGNAKPAAAIVKDAAKLGYNPTFVANYPVADPVMFDLAGKAWNGVYTAAWLPTLNVINPETPGVKKFVKAVNKYFPQESSWSYAAAGWVAADVFTEAVSRMGDRITRQHLIETLENFSGWDGDLVRNLAYGPNRREGVKKMHFLKAVNGNFKAASDWIRYEK